MLNEKEERFHPKQWNSTNMGSAQKKKETNKTLKTLKYISRKILSFWKTNEHQKETPSKQNFVLLGSSMGNCLWTLFTVYQPFKKIEIITHG